MNIAYSRHSRERLEQRGLIISDVLYVLKNGFVHQDPVPATRSGLYKYAMESWCPNGGNRTIRVIVVPDKKSLFLKIVSVMWVDES